MCKKGSKDINLEDIAVIQVRGNDGLDQEMVEEVMRDRCLKYISL